MIKLGKKKGEKMKKVTLAIDGMTCSACSNGLEKYLKKQDGSWFDTNDGNVNVKLLIQGKNTISIESSSPKLSLANAPSKESVINVIEILKNPETGRKLDIVLVVILTSLGIITLIYLKKKIFNTN